MPRGLQSFQINEQRFSRIVSASNFNQAIYSVIGFELPL